MEGLQDSKDREMPLGIDLFCEVIDNYGDAGVCWRLARQLASGWHCHVRLWIDRLAVLQKICPAIDAGLERQTVNQVDIYVWKPDMMPADIGQVPDVVIEGFGTRLPDSYLNQMAARAVKPVWINLEYLSAESWVESTHLMKSPHPRLPLTKYFYFPGFTGKTGGLIREAGLVESAVGFQSDRRNAMAFLSSLGVACREEQFIVSLFCYPLAPVQQLLETLSWSEQPVLCLIPEGTASQDVGRFIHQQPKAGTCFQDGALTVQILPVIEQSRYDQLLWSSDLNFVRGEDSFVRAQWAGRPFVWHIYPQEENAHLDKLDAFMALYQQGLMEEEQQAFRRFWKQWNSCAGQGGFTESWAGFRAILPELKQYAGIWRKKLTEQPDLATGLVRFVDSLR